MIQDHLASASMYDIVLMDMQMPVLGGLDATRRILELAPDLPIIGQTANAFAEDREKCLAAGMTGYIAKPFDSEALVCPRRLNFDPPCRLNFDPGSSADRRPVDCG